MPKTQVYLTVLVVACLLSSVFCASAALETTYKVEGYVKDQSGAPIAGAYVTFNSANVPSAQTNISGYYSTNAPAGTYRLNIWPPYNSSYINYDEQGYVVSAAATKNMTLQQGFKVYGYVHNASGSPMVGASVLFRIGTSIVYGSGYFTDQKGYYYAVLPPATYTIDAHPQTAYDPSYAGQCTPFPTYTETGYVVVSDIYRNLTVGVAPPGSFLTSGYILDQNGNPVSGAEIIYNVPDTVPSVKSNTNGYYQISSPSGTYHLNVWPPFDSHLQSYDQASHIVGADTTKNITLQTGYRVSGFIRDQNGNPVSGAVVQLGSYGSGWFSNSSGYYFLAVPAGTYSLNAHPRVGSYSTPTTNFNAYTENGVQITADLTKNIVVTVTATPTPAPTNPPTTQPTAAPTTNPTPTPTPTAPQCTLTLTAEAQNYQVGSTLTLKGNLKSPDGTPLVGKSIELSYTSGSGWTTIGLANTDAQGKYSLQWLIPASGSFTVKAQWAGDQANPAISTTADLSFLPFQGQSVFCVQSNSTISNLNFNSTSMQLGFTASGPSGSTGKTTVTIAKTLVEDATAFNISLDGKNLQFDITETAQSWILTFNYHHSSHHILVGLEGDSQNVEAAGVDIFVVAALAVAAAVCVGASIVIVRRRKQ